MWEYYVDCRLDRLEQSDHPPSTVTVGKAGTVDGDRRQLFDYKHSLDGGGDPLTKGAP